jgi:hypothetical protein
LSAKPRMAAHQSSYSARLRICRTQQSNANESMSSGYGACYLRRNADLEGVYETSVSLEVQDNRLHANERVRKLVRRIMRARYEETEKST